ncbi:MAG: hypothetical protein AB7E48_05305 [Deferribacterales bacterium]
MTQLILLLAFSGIITVDRAAGFNTMISRPLVVAVVIGLLFGSVELCFLGGLIFEIIGLVDVPVGTRISRDDSFGAYSFSLVLSYHAVTGMSSFILALMLVIVFTYPVTLSLHICRKLNKRLYLRELGRGDKFNASKLVKLGLLFHYGQGVVVYNLAFVIIYTLYQWFAAYLPGDDNYIPYIVFTIIFLSGFLLRFLSGNSYVKYVLFLCGVLVGWAVL